jgi:hypothetical protein
MAALVMANVIARWRDGSRAITSLDVESRAGVLLMERVFLQRAAMTRLHGDPLEPWPASKHQTHDNRHSPPDIALSRLHFSPALFDVFRYRLLPPQYLLHSVSSLPTRLSLKHPRLAPGR